MKPQEKAEKLIEDFLPYQATDDHILMKIRAKYSAWLAVRLIKIELGYLVDTHKFKYWEEVEQELENIKYTL